MTRSDIATIIAIYATCIFFACMTFQLKATAQIYPLCIIGGLTVLNTLYLFRCLFRLIRQRKETGSGKIINDLPELFNGFQAGQFFFIAGSVIVYLALLYLAGFYLAGFIYLVVVLWVLKTPLWQLCLTVAVMGILIYGVFTVFLKVPLPKGLLFN